MRPIGPRQAVFTGVLLLAQRMQTRYDVALGDVTLKQWLALVVVANLPQPVASAAEVTRVLGTSHQNVTKLLTALAAKGLIRLDPSPDDGRARQVSLTDATDDLLARHDATGDRLLDDLFRGIPDHDVATCLRVLDQMSQALTGEGLTPPTAEV